MQKFLKSLSILAIIVACESSYAQPQFTSDDVLKNADLQKLINNNQALLLIAQFKDPNATTNNLNDLNDFVALGTLSTEPTTYMTEFDSEQNILNQCIYNQPWIGVATYQQNEIPAVTLQDGLALAQACLPKPITDQIAGVAIYKTIYGGQMVYNYEFKRKGLRKGLCQQVLYSPTTNTCQLGMVASCHFDVTNPLKKKQ